MMTASGTVTPDALSRLSAAVEAVTGAVGRAERLLDFAAREAAGTAGGTEGAPVTAPSSSESSQRPERTSPRHPIRGTPALPNAGAVGYVSSGRTPRAAPAAAETVVGGKAKKSAPGMFTFPAAAPPLPPQRPTSPAAAAAALAESTGGVEEPEGQPAASPVKAAVAATAAPAAAPASSKFTAPSPVIAASAEPASADAAAAIPALRLAAPASAAVPPTSFGSPPRPPLPPAAPAVLTPDSRLLRPESAAALLRSPPHQPTAWDQPRVGQRTPRLLSPGRSAAEEVSAVLSSPQPHAPLPPAMSRLLIGPVDDTSPLQLRLAWLTAAHAAADERMRDARARLDASGLASAPALAARGSLEVASRLGAAAARLHASCEATVARAGAPTLGDTARLTATAQAQELLRWAEESHADFEARAWGAAVEAEAALAGPAPSLPLLDARLADVKRQAARLDFGSLSAWPLAWKLSAGGPPRALPPLLQQQEVTEAARRQETTRLLAAMQTLADALGVADAGRASLPAADAAPRMAELARFVEDADAALSTLRQLLRAEASAAAAAAASVGSPPSGRRESTAPYAAASGLLTRRPSVAPFVPQRLDVSADAPNDMMPLPPPVSPPTPPASPQRRGGPPPAGSSPRASPLVLRHLGSATADLGSVRDMVQRVVTRHALEGGRVRPLPGPEADSVARCKAAIAEAQTCLRQAEAARAHCGEEPSPSSVGHLEAAVAAAATAAAAALVALDERDRVLVSSSRTGTLQRRVALAQVRA